MSSNIFKKIVIVLFVLLSFGYIKHGLKEEPVFLSETKNNNYIAAINLTHSIYFDLNGGTSSVSYPSKRTSISGKLPSIDSIIPIKTGHVFMGWYDNPDYTKGTQYYNSSNEAKSKYTGNSNLTLYAGWKAYVLSIYYNGNGGTWNSKSTIYGVNSKGTAIVKNTNRLYKQSINYGTSLDSSGLVNCNGSWLNWVKTGYHVNKGKEYFIMSGSTKIEINQDKLYTAKQLASYAGCNLSMKDCNIDVKVNWKPNVYKVTFNLNTGNGENFYQTVNYGEKYPSISSTIPTKIGYTFMGWYDNPDYTKGTQYYNASNQPLKNYTKTLNTTLYAGWKSKTYTVYFNANNSLTSNIASITAIHNQMMPKINFGKEILFKVSKSGYIFMGWYDNKDYTKGTQYYNASNQPLRNFDKTSNVVLYAGWKETVLSIQYNGNGGTWNNPIKNIYSVNANGTVILKVTKKTYEQQIKSNSRLESSGLIDYNGEWFNWKRNGHYIIPGEEYYVAPSKTVLSQDKVYTAKQLARYGGCDLSNQNCTIEVRINWNPNRYTVVYDKNNVSAAGITESSIHTYDTSKVLNSIGYKLGGHVFDGWNTKPNGSGINYSNGQSVKNLTTIHDGIVTLYAKWRACTPGQYAMAGALTCSLCPVGNYSNSSGSSSCTPCPIGQYNDSKGAVACKHCTGNTYAKTTGQSACMTCPKGYRANGTHTGCIQNVLTVRYNGNGQTGFSSSDKNKKFTLSASNNVLSKGNIYGEQVGYGELLNRTNGLSNCDNPKYMKFVRNGYVAEKGREWYVVNANGVKTYFNQDDPNVSAIQLANAGGCDLSKQNCTITVRVNWKEKPSIASIKNKGAFVTVNVTSVSPIVGYYFATNGTLPKGNEDKWIPKSSKKLEIAKLPGKYWVYAKDSKGNISDAKTLTITLDEIYKNIQISKTQKGYIKKSLPEFLNDKKDSISNYNNFIAESVRSAGLFTKEGVVTAGLAGIAYLYNKHGVAIPYVSNYICFGQRYNVQFGSNPKWGQKIKLYGDAKTAASREGGIAKYCKGEYGGLDCQAFVGWSVHNAGFKAKSTYGDYGNVIKKCSQYDKKSNGTTNYGKCDKLSSRGSLKEMYKTAEMGDILVNNTHVMLVLKNDTSKEVIYVMEGTTPVGMHKYTYSELVNSKYWALTKMANYYKGNHACLKDEKNNSIKLPISWNDKRSSFNENCSASN